MGLFGAEAFMALSYFGASAICLIVITRTSLPLELCFPFCLDVFQEGNKGCAFVLR